MKRALLYSGGFDSSCLWWALGKPPAVYCGGDFGPARYANHGELDAIARQVEVCPMLGERLTMIEYDFRPFMRHGEYHFPREMVCCQLAWAHGFDVVQIGYVKDDGMTPAWALAQEANFGAAVGMAGFRVEFPAAELTKAELLEKALRAGMPLAFIEASHSCVRSSMPCGECVNCKARETALGVLSG